MSFRLTWKSQIICLVISYISVTLIRPAADAILSEFFMQEFMFFPTGSLLINFYIYVLLLLVPITIVHEFIHGCLFMAFGGKIRYGFKGIYVYTMEISGKPIERNKFLIVLSAPVLLMSILILLWPPWLWGMVFLLNLLGASGDIYMVLFLLRFSPECCIIDRTYGFDVVEKQGT
jgi:hypothetical protein